MTGAPPWLVLRLNKHQPWVKGFYSDRAVTDEFGQGNLADDAEGISVYEVDSNLMEAQVAAALWAGGLSIGDPVYLLRIPRQADMQGVDVRKTSGSTPFRSVNERHRDLFAARDAFEQLSRFLMFKVARGDDVVRVIHGHGLGSRIPEFIAGDDVEPKRMQRIPEFRERVQRACPSAACECPAGW